MWLTRECDYGLVVLVFLGTEGKGRVASCEEMSDRLSIPYDFLAKILQNLCRSGLVASKRGAHGGYLLTRDLSAIRLTDVIRAVDEPPLLVDCVEPEACRCPRLSRCVLVEPMRALHQRLAAVLDSITIDDLVSPSPEEQPSAVQGAAPDAR